MNDNILTQLAMPFEPKHITWKPGKATSDGAKCMAMTYADLRAYMHRLDDVCGMDWSVAYEPWGGDRIICRLTINGITRSSTGEMDSQDEKNGLGGTVAEAQAFKRACAMFSLGRYLYDMPNQWVEFDNQRKRITEAGLAKLEASYKAWYAANTLPAPVVAPVAPREVPLSKSGKPLTPQQQLWGAGLEAFGEQDWENGARRWLIMNWTEFVAKSTPRDSASDLTDAERIQLASYIVANAIGLQKKWATYQAAEAQAARGTKATV